MIDRDAVRRLRTDRGLSQRRLAEAAGVDPLTVKRLEAGADDSDLPLRVLDRLAATLAVPVSALLREQQPAPDGDELAAAIGAALLAHRRTTVTNLSTALNAPIARLEAGLEALDGQLAAVGMSVARRHDEVWLVPRVPTPAAAAADRPLNVAEARLLRRIHRGEDVRRKLSRPDREFILPALQRRGLVVDHGDGPTVAPHVATSLGLP